MVRHEGSSVALWKGSLKLDVQGYEGIVAWTAVTLVTIWRTAQPPISTFRQ